MHGELNIKTHPGVLLEVNQLGIGRYPRGDTLVVIVAELINRSAPTMLDSWKLDVKTVKGEVIRDISPGFDPSNTSTFTTTEGKVFKMDESDMIFSKTTTNPVQTGARVAGVIQFEIRGKQVEDLRVDGTVFTLKCKNAARDDIKVSYVWDEKKMAPFGFVPGTNMKPQP
jgi:hypothetical protein